MTRTAVRAGHRTALVRCPACGHHLEQATPSRCPLCDLDFGDDRVTGLDTSPYARTYAQDNPGWWAMCAWVWFAGPQRLKHLALMRSSAASRRFRRINTLLLSLALGLLEASRIGWRWVSDVAAVEPTGSTLPVGAGWFHMAATPRPLPTDLPRETAVDAWWNPAQGVVAFAAAVIAAWLLLAAILYLLRVAVSAAHRPPYDREGRMTAALHYSTAWLVLLIVPLVILALRPFAFLGSIGGWRWSPSRSAFELPGAALAACICILWWFWLIRLGSTAPLKTRGMVVACFAILAPLLAGGAAVLWRLWPSLYAPLFSYMQVMF